MSGSVPVYVYVYVYVRSCTCVYVYVCICLSTCDVCLRMSLYVDMYVCKCNVMKYI